MQILIDDSSPQINYISNSNGWINDHRTGATFPDQNVKLYSQQTFHTTQNDGDRMEFRFNGTGISVVGAKRNNHGVFGVKIDDEQETYHSGHSAEPIFQTVIYDRSDLSTTQEHLIAVTNYPSRNDAEPSDFPDAWLDIDHILITQSNFDVVDTTIIEDTSSQITYDAAWTSGGPNPANHNSTVHLTSTLGSSFKIPFNGTSIQIFSGLNLDHGGYTVSLDGGPEWTYNGYHYEYITQIPHFTASGLAQGQHILKVTNRGNTTNAVLGFDYAVINSTASPGVPVTSTIAYTSIPTIEPTPNGNELSTKSSKTNVAAIAGGVVGGIVGLIIVALLGGYLLRRKARQTKDHQRSYIDFAGDRTGGDTEHKSFRSRMISTTSGVTIGTAEENQHSPSLFGSLTGLLKNKSQNKGRDEEVASLPSPSHEGSIAHFYTPNRDNQVILSSQADSFDSQIYRIPNQKSRLPIVTPLQIPQSRRSMTSASSAYSHGGETYLTGRLDRANQPIPLPSPPSQESSEYDHLPLPPLPNTINANPATGPRPNLLHADASSTLLPPSTMRQLLTFSTPTAEPIMKTQVATPKPNELASPNEVLDNGSSSPSISGDLKASLLYLSLNSSPARTRLEVEDNASSSPIGIDVSPSELDLEPLVLSPPPDYTQATSPSK
ncbi:uncharacterized protein IL334_007262 [Kwoniella shivajii]|uniref:Transmembrane protein n=1 Tax=Kwoniella shivajii TaxID=564305 RepID=A0ABZ1D871_9TREE|nr:hypothetical protein IL334_007262 [Kwoniella shivajii]